MEMLLDAVAGITHLLGSRPVIVKWLQGAVWHIDGNPEADPLVIVYYDFSPCRVTYHGTYAALDAVRRFCQEHDIPCCARNAVA
jgi:hypothetical protein